MREITFKENLKIQVVKRCIFIKVFEPLRLIKKIFSNHTKKHAKKIKDSEMQIIN
jgi:hypothetical protein